MAEFVGGLPYGASKHVQGMLNGGMTAKEAAAVALAYKQGGVGAGLFATGYYGADLGLAVDKKGNVKIGAYVIPERLTHTPWFEIIKLGAMYKQSDRNLTSTLENAGKMFVSNAPGSEIFKAEISRREGEDSWASKYLLGNIAPQAAIELQQDWKKGHIKNRPKKQ